MSLNGICVPGGLPLNQRIVAGLVPLKVTERFVSPPLTMLVGLAETDTADGAVQGCTVMVTTLLVTGCAVRQVLVACT